MYYGYAMISSNTCCEMFIEFLRIEFPRISFSDDHQQLLKPATLCGARAYRVMEKYPKDPRGRRITDPTFYYKIAIAIAAMVSDDNQ